MESRRVSVIAKTLCVGILVAVSNAIAQGGCWIAGSGAPGPILNTAGNPNLDFALLQEAGYQNQVWGTQAQLFVYSDAPPSAQSAPTGQVYIGVNITSALLGADPTLVALTYVLAHEWAHQAQFRIFPGIQQSQLSIQRELQADCLAGYYLGRFKPNDWTTINPAIQSAMQLGDNPMVPFFHPKAHGTGPQRIAAVQQGFMAGLTVKQNGQLLNWPQLVGRGGVCGTQ